ncbi:MAG: hypothetical protein HOI67_14680 [Gammaproteobacteria bacterium]|nr:hypothetical protein [Gammaproteobacteria bacterium]
MLLGLGLGPVKELKKFQQKEKRHCELLSDEDHAIAETTSAWDFKKSMGRESIRSNRMSVLVGIDGKIKQVM